MRHWSLACLVLIFCTGVYAKEPLTSTKTDYFDLLSSDGWLMRWPKNKLPIKIYLEDGSSVSGYRPQFRDILLSSFYSWSDATGGKLNFVRAASEKEADIICTWTKTWNDGINLPAGKPNAGSSIYEQFDDAGVGNIVLLKVHIKLPTRRALDGAVVTDAEMKCTCLHEIGHALGIDIHSPNSKDMMFRFNNAFKVKPILSQRDVHTIQKLYSTLD